MVLAHYLGCVAEGSGFAVAYGMEAPRSTLQINLKLFGLLVSALVLYLKLNAPTNACDFYAKAQRGR